MSRKLLVIAALCTAVVLPRSVSAQVDDDIEIETIVDDSAGSVQSPREVEETVEPGDMAEFADEDALETLEPSEPRYQRVVRKGQVITGALLAGVPWIFSLLGSMIVGGVESSGCSDCQKVAGVLWIPIAGPALTQVVDDTQGLSPIWQLLFLWSGAQAGGVVLLSTGLAGHMRVVESDRTSLSIEPVVRPGTFGAVLNISLRANGW